MTKNNEFDLFGVQLQNSMSKERRRELGAHYTNVENILKVIKPLFLENLEEELKKSRSVDEIIFFLNRLSNIKIFDPACGCGNFLVVTYKELKTLEKTALKKYKEMTDNFYNNVEYVRIENFYGIEIDESAVELAYDCMSFVYEEENVIPLPISKKPKIIHGNALRIDWNDVCKQDENSEIYIIGNPPYLGSKNQNDEHKEDMNYVFKDFNDYKKLDFIGAWFYLASKYIKGINAKACFVSTNSICQGEQVGLLWPKIFSNNIEIDFAYTSFLWNNEAKGKAAVYVIIVGLCNESSSVAKKIFSNNISKKVININPYLAEGENLIIEKQKKSISNFPTMRTGNMPCDNGNFILLPEEKDEFLETYPNAKKYIRKLIGSKEFIQGEVRYCIWIEDIELDEALLTPQIKERIDNIRKFRSSSNRKETREAAKYPHRFAEIRDNGEVKIVIPQTSSERRDYIPMGILDKGEIITNLALGIATSEFYILGVLLSKLHNLWVRTIGGRLKQDIRCSPDLTYNTFPFPQITVEQKKEIEDATYKILDIREMYSGKTLADLYDPDKMPNDLRDAHHNLDLIIEKCYQNKPFKDNNERLQVLFKMYKEMTGK